MAIKVAINGFGRIGRNVLRTALNDPELDFVEIYNHSNQPADLSGCHLTDDPATNKFTFAPGVTLEPRGFLALDQTQLGFALSSAGETVYLVNTNCILQKE